MAAARRDGLPRPASCPAQPAARGSARSSSPSCSRRWAASCLPGPLPRRRARGRAARGRRRAGRAAGRRRRAGKKLVTIARDDAPFAGDAQRGDRARAAAACAARSTSCRSRPRPTRCCVATRRRRRARARAVRGDAARRPSTSAQRFGERDARPRGDARSARRRSSSASIGSPPSAPARCCSAS